MKYRVSIIITTRNRASHLRETLASFQRLHIPREIPTELLVVDNASTDETVAVAKACSLSNLVLRYCYEPKPGQANARNTGLANTSGEIILFTDDDVRVNANWFKLVISQLLDSPISVVVGLMRMASHLHRPWMTDLHRGYLASSLTILEKPELLGGNMAVRREVLKKVSGFDPELGPGALGFGDDTLFGFRLESAGFSAIGLKDAIVEHHFDESRLRGSSLVDASIRRGRSMAYIHHHWLHGVVTNLNRKIISRRIELMLWRLTHCKIRSSSEGFPEEGLRRFRGLSFLLQFRREKVRRPAY